MKNLVISHCYFAVDSYEMSKDLRLPYTLEHLKKCLASKRCSVSRLNCRYLNPYIKFKLIELAISLYLEFWNIMNCQIFRKWNPNQENQSEHPDLHQDYLNIYDYDVLYFHHDYAFFQYQCILYERTSRSRFHGNNSSAELSERVLSWRGMVEP